MSIKGGDMADEEERGYAFPEFLVDAEWMVEHLYDDNVRIVDTDVDAAYQRGHIPGAVLVPDNYEKDASTNRVHILPPEKFAEMAESLGIGDDTTVVTYDNSRSLYAGRLWWALRYYGHHEVKVLNGGWRRWIGEGRPISLRPPHERAGVRFTARPDPSLIVTTEQLINMYDSPEVAVWDVRNREEYAGQNARRNARPGHIPGAKHLEWVEMVDETTHTFKPAEEMRRILGGKGITPEKEVVAH